MNKKAGVVGLVLLLAACGGGAAEVEAPTPGGDTRPPAPWAGGALAASAVPAVYLTEWSAADNRQSCALIAPVAIDRGDATPRAATFSGGWAVAYDVPGQRSAFGVAGTGTTVGPDTYDAWPHRIDWSDGSSAGYGPEGGTGPNQLAYLEIAGQTCLYNVWSNLGVDHLEWLIGKLRFVRR